MLLKIQLLNIRNILSRETRETRQRDETDETERDETERRDRETRQRDESDERDKRSRRLHLSGPDHFPEHLNLSPEHYTEQLVSSQTTAQGRLLWSGIAPKSTPTPRPSCGLPSAASGYLPGLARDGWSEVLEHQQSSLPAAPCGADVARSSDQCPSW